jgi:Protein NO VEIN, C-terminal
MEIAMGYETREGRSPKDVSREGIGYDIESNGRKIEVKGVGESWKTYTWQAMYTSEVERLNANKDDFFLYIVKFSDEEQHTLYIIPGIDLLAKFQLKIASYSLTPISRGKLREFIKAGKHI